MPCSARPLLRSRAVAGTGCAALLDALVANTSLFRVDLSGCTSEGPGNPTVLWAPLAKLLRRNSTLVRRGRQRPRGVGRAAAVAPRAVAAAVAPRAAAERPPPALPSATAAALRTAPAAAAPPGPRQLPATWPAMVTLCRPLAAVSPPPPQRDLAVGNNFLSEPPGGQLEGFSAALAANRSLLRLDLRSAGLQRRACELLIEAAEKNRVLADISGECSCGAGARTRALTHTLTHSLTHLLTPTLSLSLTHTRARARARSTYA